MLVAAGGRRRRRHTSWGRIATSGPPSLILAGLAAINGLHAVLTHVHQSGRNRQRLLALRMRCRVKVSLSAARLTAPDPRPPTFPRRPPRHLGQLCRRDGAGRYRRMSYFQVDPDLTAMAFYLNTWTPGNNDLPPLVHREYSRTVRAIRTCHSSLRMNSPSASRTPS